MLSLGTQIREARRRLGLTLDTLAERVGMSKPYLSLIENQHVHNPSDEKLRRLETVLGFAAGELLHQAHLHRTPADIRAVLAELARGASADEVDLEAKPRPAKGKNARLNLDAAYLSGVLHQLVDRTAGNIEAVGLRSVPVINRVSAGYPKDFTDLAYPRGVADDYVGCPNLPDPDAFAARVHGDSMSPKYAPGDVVIFSPAAVARDGDDCFIRMEDGQTTFKRVFFEKNGEGQAVIRLQPRNEKYLPQVLPSERVSAVYRAMYRYQAVDET